MGQERKLGIEDPERQARLLVVDILKHIEEERLNLKSDLARIRVEEDMAWERLTRRDGLDEEAILRAQKQVAEAEEQIASITRDRTSTIERLKRDARMSFEALIGKGRLYEKLCQYIDQEKLIDPDAENSPVEKPAPTEKAPSQRGSSAIKSPERLAEEEEIRKELARIKEEFGITDDLGIGDS